MFSSEPCRWSQSFCQRLVLQKQNLEMDKSCDTSRAEDRNCQSFSVFWKRWLFFLWRKELWFFSIDAPHDEGCSESWVKCESLQNLLQNTHLEKTRLCVRRRPEHNFFVSNLQIRHQSSLVSNFLWLLHCRANPLPHTRLHSKTPVKMSFLTSAWVMKSVQQWMFSFGDLFRVYPSLVILGGSIPTSTLYVEA